MTVPSAGRRVSARLPGRHRRPEPLTVKFAPSGFAGEAQDQTNDIRSIGNRPTLTKVDCHSKSGRSHNKGRPDFERVPGVSAVIIVLATDLSNDDHHALRVGEVAFDVNLTSRRFWRGGSLPCGLGDECDDHFHKSSSRSTRSSALSRSSSGAFAHQGRLPGAGLVHVARPASSSSWRSRPAPPASSCRSTASVPPS